MKKASVLVLGFTVLNLYGCSNLFISYCDRVARGTADKNWVLENTSTQIPFSKAEFRDPNSVCVTAQGETAEAAAGKNFSYELVDANDKVIAKRNGKTPAQPINTENKMALWGGQHASNKNAFESTECFNVAKLDPFVKLKVKKLSNGATDESKLWAGGAYCKR